jgi:hypothetical protein
MMRHIKLDVYVMQKLNVYMQPTVRTRQHIPEFTVRDDWKKRCILLLLL